MQNYCLSSDDPAVHNIHTRHSRSY